MGTGDWSDTYDPNTLSDGTQSVQVRQLDLAGNVSAVQFLNFRLDKTAPTLTISSDRTLVKSGDVAQITFTFSEDPGTSFSEADLLITGGTLTWTNGTGLVRKATFTPTVSGTSSDLLSANPYKLLSVLNKKWGFIWLLKKLSSVSS